MEYYLGRVNGKPSKSKQVVLRNNGIKTRYYGLDKQGNITHTNAQIAANAVRGLFDDEFGVEDIDLLACGTSMVDQMLPSHASMVHGELGGRPMEIISPSGACSAGMHAFNYAYLSVLAGNAKNAVSLGSELLSPIFRSQYFEEESKKLAQLMDDPIIAFEKDFLRWMLSDGAGAALLQPDTAGDSSLEIEWIENISFANELGSCMYAGGEKLNGGEVISWKKYNPQGWLDRSVFAMKQDVKILGENIVKYGSIALKNIMKKRNFDPSTVDYFLPHLSSEYFAERVATGLESIGVHIDRSKWFYNLPSVGNVGSASIYLMLNELFHSGRLQPGERILLMVPESARFSYSYALLKVV